MPSINIALDFFDHPKTQRLVGRLGRGSEVLLFRLWCYCGKHYYEDGRLVDLSAAEIETVAKWWGKTGEMVSAMKEVEFMEFDGAHWIMVGWSKHQSHIARYKKAATKMLTARWSKPDTPEDAASNAARIRSALPVTVTEDITHTNAGARAREDWAEIPSEAEVLAEAQRIGLAAWRAKDWWLSMEAVSWKVKGQEVTRWRNLLARVKVWWESDGRPMSPPTNKKNDNRNPRNSSGRPDRNAGTANEGTTDEYGDLGRLAGA